MSVARAAARRKIALLFGSGLCALIYQSMWLRELREVFGASTLANAAVLAVFMGGLGLGGALFGRRAERSSTPLRLYGHLEIGVALGAAVSPFLVDGARAAYIALGGSSSLGPTLATVVRLVLTAIALGLPATLMGGTFPAMARALLGPSASETRRPLAFLYGANTIGAVVGVLSSSFLLLDVLGVRQTLWAACALNALIGMAARSASRAEPPTHTAAPAIVDGERASHATMRSGGVRGRVDVLVASFVAGFAFLLLELVWSRMGAPLLGGTTYSFAVILALALAGIGAGGLLYAFVGPERPARSAFAITCALEAALLLVPFALGDHLAALAASLRESWAGSFGGVVCGFIVVGSVLVVPAAVVSGFQFPLLLALAGDGADGAAKDSGDVYAANTLGSICGSLAGGFGALPFLGATGAWRGAALVLVVAGAVLGLAPSVRGVLWQRLGFVVFAAIAAALAAAPGPSAAWRHGGIGAGRGGSRLFSASTPNEVTAAQHARSRLLVEKEGVESNLGIQISDGWSLIVNGKSDGSTFGDRQTQIALALIPALFHDALHANASNTGKRGFVIGLGTGETAGWLASVPAFAHVDVVELEPDMKQMVMDAGAANQHALENEKLALAIGDGREKLATAAQSYDVILSQPSNPYRAGVAGFFSRDFYRAVHARLAAGGVFCQWMQTYEVDPEALRMVVATLKSEFTTVDAFSPKPGDLLFLARNDAAPLDVARLRADLASEPYRTAFDRILMQPGVAGFLGEAEADDAFLTSWSADETAINTDDRPLLELSLAQSVGRHVGEDRHLLRRLAGDHVLPALSESVDPVSIEAARARVSVVAGVHSRADVSVEAAWSNTDLRTAAALEKREAELAAPVPDDDAGRMIRAHVAAVDGGSAALERSKLDALAADGFGAEVALIDVEAAITDGRLREIPALLEKALAASDAWVHPTLYRSVFLRLVTTSLPPDVAVECGRILVEHPLPAKRAELPRYFAAAALHEKRRGPAESWCTSIFTPLEPYPPWERDWLTARAACYAAHAPERASSAAADLASFRAHEDPSSL